MDPKVVVIVVNWNRGNDTVECVRSLNNMKYSNFEIIIIDNASSDGSTRIIKEEFPHLLVIHNSKNFGYGEGNNIGIRHALRSGADYILLFNNDAIADEMLLDDLLDVAEEDGRIGIVGPKIYDYWIADKVWFAGASIDWMTGESPHFGLGERDEGQFNGVIETDRLTGCAMMVKREVFETIGLFDPDYFLYYEDVDLCVRAKKGGYKSICVQTAKVWHKESSSTRANEKSELHSYYHTRNRLLFLQKHFKIQEEEKLNNHAFMREYIRNLLLRPFARKYRKLVSTRFWAITDFYRGRFGIKRKYHRSA